MRGKLYAAFAALVASSSAFGQVLFAPEIVRAGDGPDAVISGDLNGDGLADIVASHTSSRDVRVWINLGSGRFSSPQVFNILGSSSRAAPVLGDINGDGFTDVVVAETNGYRIHVLINDGNGMLFAAPFGSIPTGAKPRRVELGDIDGDGDLDYVVTSDTDVSIRVNRGDGLPNQGAYSYAVANDLEALVVDDFDGDGDLDIAAASASSNDLFILTNEAGLFEATVNIEVGGMSGFRDLASVDFNMDGKLDFVGSETGGPDIAYVRNLGDDKYYAFTVATGISGFRGGRMDSDGDGDILIGNDGGSTPQILLLHTDEDGPGAQQPITIGEGAIGVAFGDFDGDGQLDIICTAKTTDALRLVPGDHGEYPANESVTLPNVRLPSKILSADIDLDGTNDLLIGYDHLSTNGTFIDGATAALRSLTQVMPDFDLCDLDGDNRPDLVFIVSTTQWGWSYNNPLGDFGPAYFRSNTSSSLRGISAGQIDGSGLDDVVLGTTSSNSLSTYLNLGPAFFTKQIDVPFVGTIVDTAFADLDGDGDEDVLALGRSRTLAILHNDGAGHWIDGVLLELTYFATDEFADGKLIVTDLNGDPYADLAILSYDGLTTMLGNSAGLFDEEVVVVNSSVINAGRSMKAGDIDQDGDIDLVASYTAYDTVGVYLNDGTGEGWGEPRFFGTPPDPNAIELMDYDEDGWLDIIVGCPGALVILRNLSGDACTGDVTQDNYVDLDDLQVVLFSFGSTMAIPIGGDVDGDRDVDLDDLQLLLFAFGTACSGGA